MQFDITVPITVYDFSNPPTHNNGSDIELNLVNSEGFFKFVREENEIHSRYSFIIQNAKNVGFTNTDQYFLNMEIKNMILALNLLMPWAALTIVKSEFMEPKIQFKSYEPSITTIDGVKSDNVIHIFNSIRATIRISSGGSENIDERLAIDLFKKIQTIKRFRMESDLSFTSINLTKALNEYENATASFERLPMFKHLFTAMELSTNCDGENLTSNNFDNAVAEMAQIDKKDVEEWREFYNRTKHADITTHHVNTTIEGMEKLPSILLPLRLCVTKIIFKRLNKN